VYDTLAFIFFVIAPISFFLWVVTLLRRIASEWRLRSSLKPESLAAQLAAALDTLVLALVDW